MRRIPLSGSYGKGLYALVDDGDYLELSKYSWYLDSTGYARRTYKDNNGKTNTIRMHKQITGLIKKPLVVDHINRNSIDNTKKNLRIVTQQVNAFNKSIQKNNKSGYSGVSFYKRQRKWVAEISLKGVRIFRQGFDTVEEAVLARENKMKEIGS